MQDLLWGRVMGYSSAKNQCECFMFQSRVVHIGQSSSITLRMAIVFEGRVEYLSSSEKCMVYH